MGRVRALSSFLLAGVIALTTSALAPAPTVAWAQIRAEPPGGRRATTVDSLTTYPVFHHLQPVRLRGRLVNDAVGTALLGESDRVLLLGDAARAARDGDVEVLGAFIDVGRLADDDPRIAQHNLEAVSQKVLGRDRPAQGELLVVLTDSVERVEPTRDATLRALALAPQTFDGQTVTVAGRFRGRNLFGDQPAAPGRSRYDFVIQLADASVWVVGRPPRADGRELRVDRRMDTGRWLQVKGDVRTARGLVWIEAIEISGAAPLDESDSDEDAAAAPVLPPPAPTVVFSAPTTDELDVRPTASVRIQFSRDMAPDSFAGNVRVRYVGGDVAAPGPTPEVTSNYDAGRRVLELTFATPLERFRLVEVRLGEGITSVDEQPLAPWTLRFTTGG